MIDEPWGKESYRVQICELLAWLCGRPSCYTMSEDAEQSAERILDVVGWPVWERPFDRRHG